MSELLSDFWCSIKAEASEIAANEPMLASFYHATLLKHESLASALSYILANKLASPVMSAVSIRETVDEVYSTHAEIIAAAAADLCAIRRRDPAVNNCADPLLYFKGFHALQAYRVGHWLWKQGRCALALFFQSQISTRLAVDIHPGATLGSGVMLDHASGIVIGETAVVENDVSILQSVTLGGTGKESGDRHPKIRRGAMIGAGAKILGNIEIGQCAWIGAGSVVLKSVAAYSTVAGVPAKHIGWSTDKVPASEMAQHFIHSAHEGSAGYCSLVKEYGF